MERLLFHQQCLRHGGDLCACVTGGEVLHLYIQVPLRAARQQLSAAGLVPMQMWSAALFCHSPLYCGCDLRIGLDVASPRASVMQKGIYSGVFV